MKHTRTQRRRERKRWRAAVRLRIGWGYPPSRADAMLRLEPVIYEEVGRSLAASIDDLLINGAAPRETVTPLGNGTYLHSFDQTVFDA